jgi:pimeloyl-ACP methyl ester carboxylesterase
LAAQHNRLSERTSSDGSLLDYRAFVPPEPDRRTALVAVHGSTRGGARHFRAILPMAIARNVPLIVPTFSEQRYGGYQTLAGGDGPLSAQRAFEATLDDVQTSLGLDTTSVDLLGVSGGAQFAHRSALVAPARVRRLVTVSAGWYTYLDPTRAFPHGCGPSKASGGLTPDVEAFLLLPLHILVGERDVERDARLRTGTAIDRRQGVNRLTRALRWVDHLEDVARIRGVPSVVSFDLLPNTGHSFAEAVHRGALVDRVFHFLHPRAAVAAGHPPYDMEGPVP